MLKYDATKSSYAWEKTNSTSAPISWHRANLMIKFLMCLPNMTMKKSWKDVKWKEEKVIHISEGNHLGFEDFQTLKEFQKLYLLCIWVPNISPNGSVIES